MMFRAKLVNSILGNRCLGIRFPHKKTEQRIEEINNVFPVTKKGIVTKVNLKGISFINVAEVVTYSETWSFAVRVNADGKAHVYSLCNENDRVWYDTQKIKILHDSVPSDVLRYAMIGEEFDYEDFLKEHEGEVYNGSLVTVEIPVRSIIYEVVSQKF